MKKGYVTNIEKDSLENDNFRKVLYTAKNSQLVLMSLLPGENIGSETHSNLDQFLRVESGEGKAILNGIEYAISDGSAVVVPGGVEHDIVNTSDKKMKLYTVYSPAEHKDKVVRATKAEAEASENEEEFDGVTTE